MPASPLPDSSALEAGILEDERPTRLSQVQDNVRNLLRTSVFGSVKSSPTSTPTRSQHQQNLGQEDATSILFPVRFIARPEVLPSPVAPSDTSGSSTSSRAASSVNVADFPQPPETYQSRVQQMAHQSALFNTRAVAALNHPDLSDPSLENLSQQKTQHMQRKAWKRRTKRPKKAVRKAAGSRAALCLLSSLLLAALVATYVTIATTASDITTTFHVLFVLGICLATIVFAYSLIRLFVLSKRRARHEPAFVSVSREGYRRRHHHHRHHHHRPHGYHSQRHPQPRQMPSPPSEPQAFVPPTPIPVHLSSDDVREDPHVAQPTEAAERPAESWDKDVQTVPNPPPAYGRWRDSVRANPDLLHWQPIPSPANPATPALPSPTYEEAMAASEQSGSPPSYVTRESPARQRDVREARAGIAQSRAVMEPEMVEVRAVGVGLAI